ncbi:MAG: hypothetical protein KAI39_11075 [Desulfobulbaceae bacterium]|nr:hypothetical protein [Desulfobulbaceae bacterium]
MNVKTCAVWFTFLLIVFMLCTTASAQPTPWKLVMQFPELGGDVKAVTPVSLGLDMVNKRYYLVDADQGKIISFDEAGKYVASFNGGGQLQTPVAVARNSTGKLWVIERAKNQLLYIDIRKKLIRDFSLQNEEDHLIVPGRIALDKKDQLYLLDLMSGSVLLLDDDLKIARRYTAPPGSAGFCDFKIKADGVFALDCLDKKVYGFAMNGDLRETIPLPSDLMFPSALEVEGANRIYILDRHVGKISVFDRQGQFKFDFLTKGNNSGQVSYGAYLQLDWENRLCVVEEGNGRVEVFGRQ